MRLPFERSLEMARRRGFLKRERKLKVALDTTNVLGSGAVKDTYNLLADGIAMLARELARLAGRRPQEWAGENGLSRYFGKSIKGQAEIDWGSRAARENFLAGLVADAERLLELAGLARSKLEEGSKDERRLLAASQLLSQLLLQDVERKEGKVQIRHGTTAERIPSVHDPEIRHGRKSASKRFDGHRVGVAVDTDQQLITAVDVMAGSARDADDALKLVEESETATGVGVEAALGDAASGSAETRRQFIDANRTLIAKVPGRENAHHFTKDRFRIDLEARSCTCPAGQVTSRVIHHGWGAARRGARPPHLAFAFDAKVCLQCPLRSQCYSPKTRGGRTVLLHPEEELLAQARAQQRSSAFGDFRRRRQVAEHRIARLVQLGLRQARYRGRTKTLFQALLAAAVANLTLVAGRSDPTGQEPAPQRVVAALTKPLRDLRRAFDRLRPGGCRLRSRLYSASADRAYQPPIPPSIAASRPGF
jgi:Transposase DDE domain